MFGVVSQCDFVLVDKRRSDLQLENEQLKRQKVEFENERLLEVIRLQSTCGSDAQRWQLYKQKYSSAIWFTPSDDGLDFSDAPVQGLPEAVTQAYFTGQFDVQGQYENEVKTFYDEFKGQPIFEQLCEPSTLRVDSHKSFFLGASTGTNNAPDVSTIPPGYVLDAATVEALLDLKPWTSGNPFSDSNCGQMVRFGVHLLDAQPRRVEVTIALTDCRKVMFIRVRHRQSSDDTRLPHVADYSVPYTLDRPNGLGNRLIRGLLVTVFHHPEIALRPHTTERLLASGSTSQVFSVIDKPDSVIKVVWNEGLVTAEVAALQTLHGVNGIVQLQASSTVALLLSPRADCSAAIAALRGSISAPQLAPIVRALRACHEKGVLHRDVRLDNILLLGGACILADFGSSTCSSAPAVYSTPMLFRIYTEFAQVDFKPAHDLLALVKSVYLAMHLPRVHRDGAQDLQWIQTFWADNLNSEPWASMVKCAGVTDYDRLESLINEYTQVHCCSLFGTLTNPVLFLRSGAVLRVPSSPARSWLSVRVKSKIEFAMDGVT
jgi:hypothetical protein